MKASRRKTMKAIAATLGSLPLIGIMNEEIRNPKKFMLTTDGKLVEVNTGKIQKINARVASAMDIKKWVKRDRWDET